MRNGRKVIDITGQKFGRLTVLNFDGVKSKKARWICKCECGNEVTAEGISLRSGHTSSCGCLARKHGKYNTLAYSSWRSMKSRCHNSNEKSYKNYGERGIKICERWNNFENFHADMGDRPSKEYSLDRIDNNANYSCGHCEDCLKNGWATNCKWSTISEQSKNKRPPTKSEKSAKGAIHQGYKKMIYNGQEMLITEASRLTGISYDTLYRRAARQWRKKKKLELASASN